MKWSFAEFLQLLEVRSQCWCYTYLGNGFGFSVPANDAILFYAVLSGSVRISGIRGDGLTALKAGDISMVLSGQAHTVRTSTDCAITKMGFLSQAQYLDTPASVTLGCGPHFNKVLCGRLKVRWPGGLDAAIMPGSVNVQSEGAMVNMPALIRGANGPGAATLLTRAAALLLTSALRSQPDSEAMFRMSNFRDPITRAMQLMETHPFQNWTVNSLARKVFLGRSTFAARFLQEVGQGPIKFLMDLRMQNAANLLTQTDLKVAEVGERVGYKSESAFIRRFFAYYKTTPGQMRLKDHMRPHRTSDSAPAPSEVAMQWPE